MLSKINQIFSKYVNTLALGIIELVIGIFLLITPPGLAVAILIATGVLLLADGLIRCIMYFREPVADAKKSHKLMSGLFILTCGVFFLFNSSFVVGIFPALAAMYGILVMMSVFLKIEMLVTLVREKQYTWYIMTCSLLFSFLAMMILFGSPVPFIGTGILLIVAAVIDTIFFLNEKGKISVPTLKALISAVVSRISSRSRKPDPSSAGFQPPQPSETKVDPVPAQQVPVPEDNGSAAQTDPVESPMPQQSPDAGIDPADEDMSWANVPQLKMPE